MKKALFCLITACFLWTVTASAAPRFPTLTGPVVDNAHLLGPAAEQKITQEILAHQKQTGEQIVVVTLDDLQGLSIDDFGYRLGRSWGIGQKGKNNGVLLIVAPHEKIVRIETGYGLEDRLTDATGALIISRNILPSFRENNFEKGIVDGTEAVITTLGGQIFSESDTAANLPQEKAPSMKWFFLLFILYILFFRRRNSSIMGPLIIGSMLGRSNSGIFGGGGGGGGIFRGGGGSFGGGGASGRW